jgi:Domain of unknown function (DUF4124)/Matrixin
MRAPTILVLLALAAAASPAAAQTAFRCKDAAGKVAFQDGPCAVLADQSEVVLRDKLAAPVEQRKSLWKGYTPPNVAAMTFYYDPSEQPVGFSAAQLEADLRAALAAWSAGCDVRLGYGGQRPARRPGTPDAVTVRWAPEYMQAVHPADGRSGILGTGSLVNGIALKPRFHEGHMRSVLIHEIGHVLGLPHNHADKQSVMSYLRDEAARRNPRPSEGDYQDCNASMRKMFGIEAPAGEGAATPRSGPRMSDREALQIMRGPSRP